MFRILIVEDDPAIREVLRTLLEAQDFRVVTAETAARACIDARAHRPDAVLVDLGLPDRDGQAVIRDIRTHSTVPIIVLSARTAEAEKVAAFDHGADDYVTKPFSAGELLARVRAALRRSVRTAEQSETVVLGETTVDLARRAARGANGPVHFTPLEYRILACLARNRGLVVKQDELIREVWGAAHAPDDTRGLRAYVKMIRQKIESDPRRPQYLVTEVGLGYRLRAE
jgi:two-component system KDP operon response regulator KdpE